MMVTPHPLHRTGFRHFQRRGLLQVRDEAYLMGWLLNLKRLAKLLPAPA